MHGDLFRTVESVHEIMVAEKTLSGAAMLRSLTDLNKLMHNANRYSEKLQMFP